MRVVSVLAAVMIVAGTAGASWADAVDEAEAKQPVRAWSGMLLAETQDFSKVRLAQNWPAPSLPSSNAGILVCKVAKGSPAEKAGIREGDVVVKIADSFIKDLKAYTAWQLSASVGKPTRVLVQHYDEKQKRWGPVEVQLAPIQSDDPVALSQAKEFEPPPAPQTEIGKLVEAARVKHIALMQQEIASVRSRVQSREISSTAGEARIRAVEKTLADARSRAKEYKPPLSYDMNVGDVGVCTTGARVVQIINGSTMLVDFGQAKAILHGLPTSKLIDGQSFTCNDILWIKSTESYETVMGSSKTVLSVYAVSPDEIK